MSQNKSVCHDLNLLHIEHFDLQQRNDWRGVRKVGDQILEHVRFCVVCNPLGLVNQFFGTAVSLFRTKG